MTLFNIDSSGVVVNIIEAEKPFGSFVAAPDGLDGLLGIGQNVFDRSAKVRRQKILNESDWTQVADSPLTDVKKSEWATYRQALRDITEQAGYPSNINWPSEP